ANDLARDVERHLHDEPVAAGPPSPWYRFRKFAWRHRAALVVVSLLLLAVVTAGGSGWWAGRTHAAPQERVPEQSRTALHAAARLAEQKQWLPALAATRQAEGLLREAGAAKELRQQLRDLQADLALVLRLEEIHRAPQEEEYFSENSAAEFAKTFGD